MKNINIFSDSLKYLKNSLNTKKRIYESYLPLAIKEEELFENYLNPLETFHSNRIEGNNYTLDETRCLIDTGYVPKGKSVKDTLEIENLSKTLKYVNSYNRELTEDFIKDVHRGITNATLDEYEDSGNYKRIRNWVGNITTSAPEHVPIHMKKLIDWYNCNKDKMDSIELATMFKYKFLCIHPFVDGNGRVSRLLFNYIITKNNYVNCIIFEEDRADYYKALQNSK